MTPEEARRLAVLEAQVAQIRRDNGIINTKLDKLIAAANMGKGAWWAMLRIGGLLILLFGAVSWSADHWGWWK
jgi:hypothetical protein